MTKNIPKGLCQCGCGKTTAIATRNRKNLGWIKGEPLRYLRGHNNLAERGPETEEDMKWCGSCKTVQPIENFAKNKSQSDGMQGFCRSCGKIKQSEWRIENREKANMIAAKCHRKKRFGIDNTVYEQMLQDQDERCAICHEKCIAKTINGVQKSLAIDHCHRTGKIRGLLCTRCNTALGLFEDNLEKIKAAIDYLEKYQ